MTSVMLVGEGPHDVGRREWSVRSEAIQSSDGWMQPFVRRLRSSNGDDIAIYLRELVTLPRRHGEPQPIADPLARKAQVAKFRAASEGCSAIIVATDADSTDPAERRRKVARIEAGFEAYPAEVIGIACVPMATSESWLLGDPTAWKSLGCTALDKLPARPERTWGRPHDPDSNHPKCLFGAICKQNDIPNNQETRAEIARLSSDTVLRVSCRTSFVPFEREVARI